MSTYRVIITPRAGSDLEAIHDHIAQDSPRNAAAMIARILDALEPLKTFPHRTVVPRQSPRLRYPVRSISVQSYTVYYRAIDDELIVRVLTVRHGARRHPRHFE